MAEPVDGAGESTSRRWHRRRAILTGVLAPDLMRAGERKPLRPTDNVYNENELDAPLANGAKFLVKFTRADGGRACIWNIKVDWADGSNASFFRGLNLCEINNVYMKYNKDTDVTSYTTD